MNESTIVKFKANASVKDIVGRGLIYDDNIAITELVKNSKDAGSTKVTITFENESSTSNDSSLTITDYGKGMTLTDIKDKWLNIAYSEKKGQTNKGKAFAGNKGVGRFSCDRLGKELFLYTKSKTGDFIKLPIFWEEFEGKGQNDEISSIDLNYEILDEESFLKELQIDSYESGTILVIKKLRSEWSRRKLEKLSSELGKFSPSLDNDFEVFLNTTDLNRKINNNILGKLSFKTTYIKSTISPDGLTIDTKLFYQGDELYTYTAENPYSSLRNISVEIHYLDTLSKTYFAKNVGISANDYGSIFLFYNGFRISPYGNDKNDWLALDRRKSQGTSRYLGTREVFGRIDIQDDQDTFSVITSREGLALNKAFLELTAFDYEEKATLKSGKTSYGFVTTIIRQLENFVVSGLDWNSLMDRLDPESKKVISDSDIKKDPQRYQLKEISENKVREACHRILKSDLNVINFKINEDLIRALTNIANQKYQNFINDFVETTGHKTLKELSKNQRIKVKQIINEEQIKTEAAITDKKYAEQQRDDAEKVIEVEKRRSSFLEELVSPKNTLDALITHVMKQISGGIEKDLKSLLAVYYKDSSKVSKEELIEAIEMVVMDVSLIKETSEMAKKADFNLKVRSIKDDIFSFLGDYVRQVASKETKWGLKIHFDNNQELSEVRSFEPAKLCVLLVNILDNARKSGAHNFYITCLPKKISLHDDGPGFDFSKFSSDDLFRKGITTTIGGSGLGLYHVKKLAEDLNANISISNNVDTHGASITLEFK